MGEDEDKVILAIEADDDASQKIDNVTRSLRNLDRQSGNMGNTNNSWATNFAKGFENAVSSINSATRQYNNIMSGFNRSVRNLVMDMGSAIYDFTSDSINNFTEFSEQHAKTLGAMSADYQKTAEDQAKFFQDAQRLKEQAMQLGTYGVTGQGALMNVTEVSEAQTELIKAGVSASDITNPNSNITRDVLTFAQANDLDTASAVEFAVSLGNQFGVDKSDWGSMLDKVSHTADMSIVDVRDIVTSMKWAGGITSGLGRDLEETLGMISVLGDFGLKGSQAGTGIQALMTRLLTGDTTVITQAQAEVAPGNALEKFYEFEKIAKPDGNLLPMSDIVEELDTVMADMTDEEQAWFAKKLFGLYQMKSAYALLNGDETDLNDVIEEIKNQSDGTNEDKLNKLTESQYGKLTSLSNLWEGIKTDFGDRLNPFVDAVRDELFNFAKNDGNYDINFDNLQSALNESCDLIEEKYGSAIASAINGIGDFAIDFTQIGVEIAPALGEGLVETFSSIFQGNFFGKDSMAENWSEMIDNMELAVDELPEDLQGLGDAIVGVIDWFGKLTAINVASNIAELISSLLQILTIAGGAMINVAGGVIVNGAAVTTGAGTSYTQWGMGAAGAGTATQGTGGISTAARGASGAGVVSGSTVVGTADDVARALGTSADDVVGMLGRQATYSVDDIAKAFGTSADDVVSALGIASKNVSKLSKFGKGLGALGIGVEVATTGYEAYQSFSSGDNKGGVEAISGGAGSIAGGLGGAKLGAAIGTAIAPGIGTAIGGVLGAIAGSFAGDWAGKKVGGSIYDANSYDKANGYKRLTTTGIEYKSHLAELQAQYDKLVEAGEGDTVAAYKLRNQISELDDAFNTMGNLTIANLIAKTEELATTVDGIGEIQAEKNAAAETTADQAKSQIASLDAMPDKKDDNQKQIAQGIIDQLNTQYNMGLEMDETGKLNMTTGEMWDAVNNATKQTKADANSEALTSYLAQYQQAQATLYEAEKTEDDAHKTYKTNPDSDRYRAEWDAALEAKGKAGIELDNLEAAIRQCYADMGYATDEIDQMMKDLAESSARTTEVDTYNKEKELGMHEEKSEAVPVEEEPKKTYGTVKDTQDNLRYIELQKENPELIDLGEKLSASKVGSLSAKEWSIALANDNGKSEYEKLATDDRKAFKDAWINAFSEEDWSDWEADFKDKRTSTQKYTDSESLDHLMIKVTSDNQYSQYYDKSLDNRGYGYNVWTGTEEQYETWLSGKSFMGTGSSKKGDTSDAYTLDDVSEACKGGITDGLGQYYSLEDSALDGLMVKITPDNEYSQYYDKSFDNRGHGYNVWTGTAQEYEAWSSKQHFTSDGQNLKGDATNAYILDDMDISEACKEGIIEGSKEVRQDKSDGKPDGKSDDIINNTKNDINSGKSTSDIVAERKDILGIDTNKSDVSDIINNTKNDLNNGKINMSNVVSSYKDILGIDTNKSNDIKDDINSGKSTVDIVAERKDILGIDTNRADNKATQGGTISNILSQLFNSNKITQDKNKGTDTSTSTNNKDNKITNVNDIANACKNGIIQGLSQSKNETKTSNMYPQPLNINTNNKATQGEIRIPYIFSHLLNSDNKTQNGTKTPSISSQPISLGKTTQDNNNQINVDDISKACKDGIIQGLGQYKEDKEVSKDNDQINAGEVNINTASSTLTGEVQIPNIVPQQMMFSQPLGKGNNAIQNEINNQINIDDTVTMQPQFTVSAPNVNVDVNVDQSGRVAKSVSILNPGQGTLLNNWYSRISSQYGKTTK